MPVGKKFHSVQIRSILIVLSCSLITALMLISARAQQCPSLLASLMPENAVKVSCQYNQTGIISLGFAAAELPFEHPCANQTTKYPGHISFEIKHYSGDGIALFKMQVGPEEQQRIANKKKELEKKKRGADGYMKTETIKGGTIIYAEDFIDCSEGVKRTKPMVDLLAVAHSGTTAINIEINGFISSEVAKKAALEVIANFFRAHFD